MLPRDQIFFDQQQTHIFCFKPSALLETQQNIFDIKVAEACKMTGTSRGILTNKLVVRVHIVI
jgi:hypothetical protein